MWAGAGCRRYVAMFTGVPDMSAGSGQETMLAWVPLAARETYYGRGYYGPHSVNIINVNIGRINVTNHTRMYMSTTA